MSGVRPVQVEDFILEIYFWHKFVKLFPASAFCTLLVFAQSILDYYHDSDHFHLKERCNHWITLVLLVVQTLYNVRHPKSGNSVSGAGPAPLLRRWMPNHLDSFERVDLDHWFRIWTTTSRHLGILSAMHCILDTCI
jgi:hypothetical protein